VWAMLFCDSDVEARELCAGTISGVETGNFDCRREQILFLREPRVYSKPFSANYSHTKPIILLREYKEITLIQVVGA
jgi:hypothetical protein